MIHVLMRAQGWRYDSSIVLSVMHTGLRTHESERIANCVLEILRARMTCISKRLLKSNRDHKW